MWLFCIAVRENALESYEKYLLSALEHAYRQSRRQGHITALLFSQLSTPRLFPCPPRRRKYQHTLHFLQSLNPFFPQELRWRNIWAPTLNCSSYFWSDHPCRMLRVLLHIMHSKAVWFDTNALNMVFGGGFGNKRLEETNKQVKQPWSDFLSGHMDELKTGLCLSNLVVLRPVCWVSIANESSCHLNLIEI